MTTKKPSEIQKIQNITMKDLDLSGEKKDMSPQAYALWVRQLFQNWRQGTVACKGRADVSYANRKPWKQKGTGRARAGSARSPLWRGGGVIFGPQPRTRKLRIPGKIKKNVLNAIFWDYLEQNKIVTFDWQLDGNIPKTALAHAFLKNSHLLDKKVTLFLPIYDALTYASFSNIPTVRMVSFDEANACNITQSEYWLVFKKDMDAFKRMISQWA